MRVVVQRCSRAEVRIDGERVGHIEKGFVLLVGITDSDTREQADLLAKKISQLRVFEDAEGKAEEAEKRAQEAYTRLNDATIKVKEIQKKHIKTCPKGYVDLGLPSGTFWKKTNEEGKYTFDEALEKFGYNLPSFDQLKELEEICEWHSNDSGYNVVGPSGDSIFIIAANRTQNGYYMFHHFSYWSCSPKENNTAACIWISSTRPSICYSDHSWEHRVRLVQ